MLIEKGAEVNKASKNESTSLHKAAAEGHFSIAKLLIEEGAKVDKADKNGDTSLTGAALNGHFEIAKLLIEKGVEVNIANNKGLTPLYWAEFKGHFEVTKLLIEKGADFHYVKEIRWRKWLAGANSVAGTTKLKNIQIELNGGNGKAKLVSLFENFASSYQESGMRDWLESLKPQVLTLKDSPQEILTKFATNQSLNFDINISTNQGPHAIGVLYIGDYLLISNRGCEAVKAQPGQVQSVFVKKLNRSKSIQNKTMNLTIINKLLKKGEKASFFYNELPKLSGAMGDDFICNIFKSYNQKSQKVGNCWWVSPKSQLFATMAMSKLQSIPVADMTEGEINQHAGKAMAEAKQIYKAFSKFSKIQLFKEYLTIKIEEKEEASAILPDFELLSRIYKKLIAKYPEEQQALLESIEPFEKKFHTKIVIPK